MHYIQTVVNYRKLRYKVACQTCSRNAEFSVQRSDVVVESLNLVVERRNLEGQRVSHGVHLLYGRLLLTMLLLVNLQPIDIIYLFIVIIVIVVLHVVHSELYV